jgi:hypothetical protein
MDINTIKLKNYSDVFLELKAHDAFYPGTLLLLNADGEVAAHNDDNPANLIPMFALEDALQGKSIDAPFAAGDPVQCWIPGRGDEVYAILEDGIHVAVGDFLGPNGDGALHTYASGAPVGIALEHLDLSGSSGTEDSIAPLGYRRRIKIRIV